MKILAINGSYHREGSISVLMDQVISGIRSVIPEAEVEKINLIDRRIEYCRGCLVCRNDDPDKAIATCVIDDDMGELCRKLDQADGYIFGNPVFMGTVTGIMKVFCERFCWVLSRPGRWPIRGCPTPRTRRQKAAVLILSTGIVPPFLRKYCDDATKFFRGSLPCMLNAKIVGTLYAGKVGMGQPRADRYFLKAAALGKKLGRRIRRLSGQAEKT